MNSRLPFITFQKPIPSLSLLTQVGRVSGTRRRKRLALYSGANHPLLYSSKGRGSKSWAKGGEERRGEKLVGGGLIWGGQRKR